MESVQTLRGMYLDVCQAGVVAAPGFQGKTPWVDSAGGVSEPFAIGPVQFS